MGWQDKVRDKFRDENEFPMSHIFVVHPESYWPLIMEVAEEQAGDEMRGNLRNYILDYTLERPLQVVLDTTPELDDSDGFREHCEVVDNFLSDFM